MSFRDDDEAARARADALQIELDQREAELAKRDEALAEAREELADARDALERRAAGPRANREPPLEPEASSDSPTSDSDGAEQRVGYGLPFGMALLALGGIFGLGVFRSKIVAPMYCDHVCARDKLVFVRPSQIDLVRQRRKGPNACMCGTAEQRGQMAKTGVVRSRALKMRAKGEGVYAYWFDAVWLVGSMIVCGLLAALAWQRLRARKRRP